MVLRQQCQAAHCPGNKPFCVLEMVQRGRDPSGDAPKGYLTSKGTGGHTQDQAETTYMLSMRTTSKRLRQTDPGRVPLQKLQDNVHGIQSFPRPWGLQDLKEGGQGPKQGRLKVRKKTKHIHNACVRFAKVDATSAGTQCGVVRCGAV